MLERFEETKVHVKVALALAEPGSKVHANSTRRLETANAGLAHKRLALAKAMHERLGAESPLAHHIVERKLFQTIADSYE